MVRRLILVLAACALCAGCATEYYVKANGIELSAKSYRKFGEFHGCWTDVESKEICVEAIGVDRQSATPLEEAAARMFDRVSHLLGEGGNP